MIWYRRLMGSEPCLSATTGGSSGGGGAVATDQSQQSSGSQDDESESGERGKGEDKDFGDKWEPISEEKSGKVFTNHIEETESSEASHLHNFQQQQHQPLHFQQQANNSILQNYSPTQQQQHHQHPTPPLPTSQHLSQQLFHHQVPDEVSLDSQDNPEGSNTATACTGTASSQCLESSAKENTFLFVGPLGKKRKYSRQRATSDDNESESHPPTAAGSPETPEEEMDQSQSPSPGESSQSSDVGRRPHRKNSPALQEQISGGGGGEPVSTIVSSSTLSTQRPATSPESGGDSAGDSSTSATEATGGTSGLAAVQEIISKPSPIIGAPTSVIRRVNRKKQEHPLPLNLSVSSPPENSSSNFSSSSGSSTPNLVSASPGGRTSTLVRGDGLGTCPTTNPSVIREELYFDGRSAGQGDRVFIWRYRDDVTAHSSLSSAAAGPMSPSSSSVSATSFIVPDVIGTKVGSSETASSASSTISQLQSGSHDPNQHTHDAKSTGSNASGKPPKKKLKCGDCGKEFSQLRNYRYHRSRHEGSDQFSCTCPVCGKQFNDRGYLSSHMKIHRNAKEYRCEYCTKGFNQRVAYNMHRRIHTGHRPHQCEVCQKSFSRRMLLKQHMRIHTGERPYSCGVCNKAFADRSNMLLHQRLHSGERPYVCEICKKSFSKNHHLKTHMNHHAGIKPYECPKCHARFSQSSNMKTHLKKCSGVPNPTTSQRQQMLRRNPLDIGRSTGQLPTLPPLPGVVAAAAAAAVRAGEPLPSLPSASRLLYDQQSLNLLTMAGAQGVSSTASQLSPGHSRGQVPIESLLLHLNVGRNRHPSQGGGNPQPSVSPTSSMSFPDLQMMLRNAAAAAAVSSAGSRSATGPSNQGQRSTYSNPSSPGSSSAAPSSTATGSIPGMASFGGLVLGSPTSVVTSMRRSSPPQGNIGLGVSEPVSPPSLSPTMSINQSLGIVGYSRSGNAGHIDSSVMPPPPTNGTVLRNIPSQQTLIPPELLSPTSGNVLRIDTRGMDGFQSILSPSEKSSGAGGRQSRVVPNPLMSPRRKQPSPSSLSASGSFIPLSTLESAAIASGLRSPSQVVRFLSSALRDGENPIQPNNPSPSYTRLPSLSHQNVLEAMVAAAAAEQNAAAAAAAAAVVASQPQSGSTRIRQVPSPQSHTHQQQHHQHHHHAQVQSSSSGSFHFSGELQNLPSLHGMSQGAAAAGVVVSSSGSHHSTMSPQPPPQQQQVVVPSPSSYSVITSSHLLQQHQDQQQLNLQQQQQSGLTNVRFSSSSSQSSSASRLASTLDDHHHPHHHHHPAADQPQQIELHHQQQPSQQRQHGYHQSLLLNHVSQGVPHSSSSGYSSGSNSSGSSNYSAFTHSIIRSRSHSPNSIEHLRERNQEYQN